MARWRADGPALPFPRRAAARLARPRIGRFWLEVYISAGPPSFAGTLATQSKSRPTPTVCVCEKFLVSFVRARLHKLHEIRCFRGISAYLPNRTSDRRPRSREKIDC